VWILVALTIYGYLVIGPRGRIDAGRIDRHMTDFTVFTEAGAAFFDGRNPYFVANPRGWHYLYPPLFALLVAPLSVFDPESQVVIWYFVNVGLAFACLGEIHRIWRLVSDRAGPGRSLWVGACGGLAAFLPFLDCMQAGQLGIAILYVLMAGFRLFLQGGSWPGRFLAGLVLALPAVVKLVPSLPVVFLLFQQWSAVAFSPGGRRPWRRATTLSAGVLTGVFLFLLAIPACLIGWQENLAYLHLWQTRVVSNDRVGPTANFNIHSVRNQSLANAVYLLTRSTARTIRSGPGATARRDRPERIVQPEVRVAIGVTLTLLVAVGLTLQRRAHALDQATAYSLAVCATLVVSPLTWGHYYMAAVPAVLCVPVWLSWRGMPRLARLVAAIPPILSWSYYLAMPYTGAVGLLGLGTTAWFLGVSGLILWIEVTGAPAPVPFGSTRNTGIASLKRPLGIKRRRRRTWRRSASIRVS